MAVATARVFETNTMLAALEFYDLDAEFDNCEFWIRGRIADQTLYRVQSLFSE